MRHHRVALIVSLLAYGTALSAAGCTHETNVGGQPTSGGTGQGSSGSTSSSGGTGGTGGTQLACTSVSDCQQGGPKCAAVCPDGSHSCESTCVNGQCATVGCPTGLTGTTTGGVVAANIFHLPKPTGTPVVMVVQDFSGSMCEPNTAGVALADGGGGAGACAADPAQSKAGIVNTAMAAVLGGLQIGPGKLELGLFAFPGEGLSDAGPNACQVPATPTVAIGDSTVTVAPVMAVYASGLARIAGGTPTAAALLAAAQDPRLAASDPSVSKYLVLITDGLPNCNDTNPCVLDPAHHLWSDGEGHGCESPSYEQALAAFFGEPTGGAIPPPECACAVGPCTDPDGGNAGMSCCTVDPYMLVSNNTNTPLEQAFASRECLDSSNTVQAVQTLYAQGITTVVISLGYDVTDPTTLDLMAQAGLRNPVATHVQCDSESTLAADLNSLFATLLQ